MRGKEIPTVLLLIVVLLGNVVIFPMHSQVSATEQLMEQNEVEGSGIGLPIYSTFNLAQCFFATDSYTLTRVSLYVMDEVPLDDPLTVQIHDNDDSGTPGFFDDDVPGSPITLGASVNAPDNFFIWIDFPFSVSLTMGEKYWIIASGGGMDGEGYRWKDSEGDAYPGGYLALGGVPFWAVDNFNDLMFRVYGMVALDNDVGVEEIIAPKNQEMYRETNTTAMIKNYGNNNQGNFDVECMILDPYGIEVLKDIRIITFLGSGATINLTWFFTPMLEGTYTIVITTLLPGDEYVDNDMMIIDRKVQAVGILKLHDEVKIDGFPDDWSGDGALPQDTWQTNRREYIWIDAFGDDTGDGDYVYPADFRFEPGSLDLLEFRVCIDADSINFLLLFGSIDDGSGDGTDGILGFSEQIIEILIDTDRDGTGRDDTIRNARLRLDKDIGWEYALWADDWGNGYVIGEDSKIYDVVNARGSPLSNVVEISIPLSGQAIPDFEDWGYVVLIGAQDSKSLPFQIEGSRSGFMKVDLVESPEGGGGGEDLNNADPNVYDMAFAFPQFRQLDNYGSVDIMFASFSDTIGIIDADIDISEAWAQSFTAPFTCLLSSVKIYARDVGAVSMGMGIMIQTNEDMGTPDPSDDVPSMIIISSIEVADFATSYEWLGVGFSNPPLIREGETYWIVASNGDPMGDGYQWAKKGGDPWPEGTSARYIGSFWSQQNDDMLFAASYRELTTVDAYQAIYFAPIVINGVYANGSVDKEWINIYYNGTTNAPNLGMNNWTLTDQDGNVFQFSNFILSNKNVVTVHSGSGINTSTDLYWGGTIEVWHDYGDDVLLNSSFIVPVDFMNYTDGVVFGNAPPYGL
ncbi:MAG: glucodextranase DOMON-like domain-containing protein, partial [Thermoplasmata archaeon]